MKRIVAKGRKRSDDMRQPRRGAPNLPRPSGPKKRQVADGPSPSAAGTTPATDPPPRPVPLPRPSRTAAQARKDASNVKVVASSLRDQSFLAVLQRGAPDIVRVYLGTKMKSRGCGGCGMKSLFRMVHDEISRRRESPALADAVRYLKDRGWF